MFGLPSYAIAIMGVVIAGAVAAGIFYLYRRYQYRFRRFYGVESKSGTEASVKGVVRQVLRRMIWQRRRLEAKLELEDQWASEAIDTEASLEVHHDADQVRRQLLRQNTEISRAVVAAAHFGHEDVAKELGLAQHLPSQGC